MPTKTSSSTEETMMPARLSLLRPRSVRPQPMTAFARIAPMEPDVCRERSFSVGMSNHSDAGMGAPGAGVLLVPWP